LKRLPKDNPSYFSQIVLVRVKNTEIFIYLLTVFSADIVKTATKSVSDSESNVDRNAFLQ